MIELLMLTQKTWINDRTSNVDTEGHGSMIELLMLTQNDMDQ